MDVFKFNNPTAPTKLESGQIINGLKSKLWVERYRDPGEFELVANAQTGLRELLPLGTLISHTESTEVMIVENHEISDAKDKEPEIKVTGRGFETYFDQRVVGSNKTFPSIKAASDLILDPANTWDQALALLEAHLLASELIDDDDALPYLQILNTVVGTGVVEERILKRGSLYARLMEILKVENLGIKIVRPGTWSPVVGTPDIAAVIHKGVDRSDEIIFSYDTGEITSADYLWSIKKLKNAALITGKWVETVVTGAEAEYDRRWMHVEANDIDETYEVEPEGVDLDNIVAAMQQRGLEALAAQDDVAITKAEVARDAAKSTYRTDFDVGDLITVSGGYNETAKQRISEYVEIEDENGMQGYPTLTIDQEGE